MEDNLAENINNHNNHSPNNYNNNYSKASYSYAEDELDRSEIVISDSQKLVIRCVNYRGKKWIDIRKWVKWRNLENWIPTKAGLFVEFEKFHTLVIPSVMKVSNIEK